MRTLKGALEHHYQEPTFITDVSVHCDITPGDILKVKRVGLFPHSLDNPAFV